MLDVGWRIVDCVDRGMVGIGCEVTQSVIVDEMCWGYVSEHMGAGERLERYVLISDGTKRTGSWQHT